MAMKSTMKFQLTTGKSPAAMFFNDISPGRSESQLRFRVIHSWEAKNIAKAGTFLGLDLLLIDLQGTVMQGFISPNSAETYRPHLRAGATYTLQIFFATKSKEIYRVADPSLTVSFSTEYVLSPLTTMTSPSLSLFPQTGSGFTDMRISKLTWDSGVISTGCHEERMIHQNLLQCFTMCSSSPLIVGGGKSGGKTEKFMNMLPINLSARFRYVEVLEFSHLWRPFSHSGDHILLRMSHLAVVRLYNIHSSYWSSEYVSFYSRGRNNGTVDNGGGDCVEGSICRLRVRASIWLAAIYGKQNINTSKGGFLISLELLLTDEQNFEDLDVDAHLISQQQPTAVRSNSVTQQERKEKKEAKKEAYRKCLESNGVADSLTQGSFSKARKSLSLWLQEASS
ncbi:hypothetical protein Bca52824_033988 [Brassica carinata]|uniref:Uncharacterized protein n=1 Tax=Brassica carinata TaxID=52824 RepID=A0A8X7SG05_BRACI|nr:hypothetical protein Bca52824_033988 [Brassica carinata]